MEKNIKDQFKSSAVMLQEVPQSSSGGKRIFANSDCFLKRNKGEISLSYLKASRGDGTK
ncbi:MAG TPA: hypothetical protein VFM18_20780 [Methanosarcina sp.]|nr:hypothetical protein [Methanosarcina sp.]